MKKFKCTVTKETTMEIEIDDEVWTPESIKDWQDSFYTSDDLSDVVEHLARMKVNHEDGEFIEGFGIPLIDGKIPYSYLNETDISKDINICDQTSDTYVDIEEVEI